MGSVVFEGKTKEDLVKIVLATCQFPVTELDSYQAIQILEDAKMLCFVDGLANFEGGAIVTKWDFDRSEIKRHHEENLKLAAASVAWPISQRFLSSVTVPANAALAETFIEEIRSLCRSVFEKSNSAVLDSHDATEVVTLQVSLFPFFRFDQKT